MYFFTLKYERLKIEVTLLNLLIFLFIFRSSNPLFKYPFIPLYICFSLYTLILYSGRIKNAIRTIVVDYYLVGISIIVLVLCFIFTRKFYLSVFKEVINVAILLSFFFLGTILINSKKELSLYFENVNKLILIFALLISVLGLLDILDILPYSKYFLFIEFVNNSIPIDYNFALLPVFYGLLILFSYAKVKCSTFKQIFYSICFILFFTQIFLAGSKRGIILLGVLALAYIIVKIILYKRNISYYTSFNLNTNFYVISLFFVAALVYLFFSFTSFNFSLFLAVKITIAPAFPSAMLMLFPIPLLAPVIRAILPFRSAFIL